MSPPPPQSQSGQPYLHLAEAYVRFTSGAKPVNLLAVSMAADCRGRMLDSIGRPPAYQLDVLTTRPPATNLYNRDKCDKCVSSVRHEVYVDAFGSHLFMTYFYRVGSRSCPPRPRRSATGSSYRSDTVNSKSFVGKDFLRNKWKYELTVHFKHEIMGK